MSCYRYESLVREGKPIIQSFGQTQKFDDIMTKVCDFYHIDSP